jgi:hypothetical protein
LTVFTGGFVLDAAKEICAGEAVAAEDIPELVAALTEKSVLVRETDGTATRYRVREGLRERGSRWLVESGEHAPLQRRHRFWYAGAVARVNANLGLGVAAWQHGDVARAAELLTRSLRRKWEIDEPRGSGWFLEVLAWIAAAEHEPRRATMLLGAAATHFHDQDTGGTVPGLPAYHQRCERQARQWLGEAEFRVAFAQGADLSTEDALRYALEDHVVGGGVRRTQ